MHKLIRTSTVPESLNILLKGQLRYLSRLFNVIAVSSSGKHLHEVAAREGVAVYPIEIQRQIAPIKDFLSLIKLYFFFRKEKPTIVHSITPKAGLLSMLAAKMAGVPVRIHTFTGLIFPTRQGSMQKLLIAMDRLLCWSATAIYPEGEGVKNDLIKFKITSKPLKVIGNGNVNGIDTEYFSPASVSEEQKLSLRKNLGIEAGDFVYVFVGRLVRDKGINELIAAFTQLDDCSAKLLLVGPFEQELDPLLPRTITEIQTNPSIIEAGFQKDIRPYLAISDLFVFPSYREGFPNVVMQAGAMGLPCLVTDINGSNEIIISNKNGLIVPSRDVEQLCRGMRDLRTDRAKLNSMAANSRELIVSRYEQAKVWQLLAQEYQRLLKEKGLD